MPHHPTTCPLDCPDACGILVETDDSGAFVRIRGNPAHTYSRGSLCGKTAIYGDVVTGPDRLRVPLLRRSDGSFEEATWERAIDEIVRRVRPLAGEDILALHYAGNMGLVGRNFPLRVMNALGAYKTDGTICDDTATAGYQTVMGHVLGPDIETVGDSDLLVLWGIDAKRTMQHLLPRVQELAKRGVPVIAIDIYRTDTIRALEKWGGRGLVIRPGTDAALALALAELAFEGRSADLDFLRNECHGAAEFRAHVAGQYPVDRVAEITGLSAAEIRGLSEALERARKPFLKVGVGFARRRNGGMSMRSVCSLGAVLGIADRLHYESSDYFGLDAEVIPRDDLRPDGPQTETISHVGLGRILEAGRFRAAFVWGHNPAVTIPDSNRVRAGLARDDLFLVVHELFMTESARLADVVLPATTVVEHSDVLKSYGHRLMQYGKKAVDPPHEQRSNVDCFRALGKALDLPPETWDVTEDGLCAELLEASSDRIGEADLARLYAGEPVKLAPPTFADRGTPSGKIELVSSTAEAAGEPALATYVPDDAAGGHGAYWLTAAPSIATHNSTYAYSTRHAKRAGEPVCHVNPEDAERLGVEDGDELRLTNEQGSLTFPVAVSEDMPTGLLRVDGFPQEGSLPERVGINALTSPAQSDLGDGNVLYSSRVDAVPVREPAAAR